MLTGMIVPATILSVVALAAPAVLVMDQRQRKLAQQVALATTFGAPETTLDQVRSIRRERSRHLRLREILRKVFRYDPELQVAYKTLPIPLVLMLGPLVGLGAGLFASMASGPATCLMTGCSVAVMTVRGLFGWQRDRYTNSLVKQMPDMLSFVASALRSGIPITEAFRSVTREIPEPTRSQFVELMHEVALGQPIHAALLNLYHRTSVTEYAIFAVTLAVQTKSGGQLADTIQGLAETVRERLTIAARAHALSGEGKVSAVILSALPVVAGLIITVVNPTYLAPLLHEPRGKRLFVIGVSLLLTGNFTMHRMIKRAVRE